MADIVSRTAYAYELPKELIAQEPLQNRTDSRLLVLGRREGQPEHRHFREITTYLRAGDCLVLNDTKVIPARLIGNRISDSAAEQLGNHGGAGAAEQSETNGGGSGAGTAAEQAEANGGRSGETVAAERLGARIELLLLKRKELDVWETLVKPGRKAGVGTRLTFGDGLLRAEVLEVLPDGNRLIRFFYTGVFEEVLERLGKLPLPPYITKELEDKTRYQTVYARESGSAAAPTAGLHFTEELLESIAAMGVSIVRITLHVGLGTFRPVKEDDIRAHLMHTEQYEVSAAAAEQINRAKQAGGRVICVGTTSCRTLESVADETGRIIAGSGETSIFIYPGYQFRVMDGLITNFHLPESTLLMLVSAFAGRERVLAAYEEAVRERYRFFSLGDAMLLL